MLFPIQGKWGLFCHEDFPDGQHIVYSTYLGGSAFDTGRGIAVDELGNAYVTGVTCSSDFPVVNPYDATFNGTRQQSAQGPPIGSDVFVSKLSPTGQELIYSTFVGGTCPANVTWRTDWVNFEDAGNDIAVDSLGCAYVVGTTCSPDFPTVNAYNGTFGGPYDAFLLQLGPSAETILYSTFIGGSGEDEGMGIALDQHGNIYATGLTASNDFPTVNALKDRTGNSTEGDYDAFVLKMSQNCSDLLFSTYLGGLYNDGAYAVAVDRLGRAYVAGYTYSSNFPIVGGINDSSTVSACFSDAFVSILNPDDGLLVYSSTVGGHSRYSADTPYGIQTANCLGLSPSGQVFVAGATDALDFPVAATATSSFKGGMFDGFVARIDSSGSNLGWSTCIGGSNTDGVNALSVCSNDSVVLVGETDSADSPTWNALNSSINGFDDCFVMKISTEAPAEQQSTLPLLIGATGTALLVAMTGALIYRKRTR